MLRARTGSVHSARVNRTVQNALTFRKLAELHAEALQLPLNLQDFRTAPVV